MNIIRNDKIVKGSKLQRDWWSLKSKQLCYDSCETRATCCFAPMCTQPDTPDTTALKSYLSELSLSPFISDDIEFLDMPQTRSEPAEALNSMQ